MDSSFAPAFTILNGHSPEDFQYKLLYASMELQRVKAEGRLQESKLWRLEELLSIMTKERDEAREECKRLQECLLLQNTPAMGVDSPSSFMHSSSMVSSPSSSPWSLQELEEHLNNDDFCASVSAPAPFELQQALESLSQSCHDGQHLQSLFSDIQPAIENAHTNSHQQLHLQNLNQSLCFDAPQCFNVSEVKKDEMIGVAPTSVRCLSRQSSSNSTAASVRRFQQGQCSMESSEDMSPAFAGAGTAKNAPPSCSSTINNVMYVANQAALLTSCNGASMAINGLHPKASMANNGAYMANDAPAFMSSISNNGSYVSDNASPLRSYVANNEAPLAMNGLPPTPCMGNNGASQDACQTPSMGNYVAPLADNSMPATPSVDNNTTSTVYAASSPTSSTAKNAATPTSSLANNAASLTTTSTISTQSSDVLMDTGAVPCRPAKVLSTAAMSTAVQVLSACPLIVPRCNQQGIPTAMRQVHLPEPPEADPQVMLNSLPEKGKLLQAVMQAGPLLQTLLLAGPLPQWRHPPPALSTRDIPKVSLAPNNVPLPYATHMPPSAVQGPMGSFPINKKGSHRRRPAKTESCARSKKLRKLSPLPTKQGQSMHMVSGSDELH